MAIYEIQKKRNDPLHVLILWHMHQPIYRNVDGNDFLLPWVRLHAVKDYLDMVELLEEFPDVRVTFNLVPSLVEQIQDYTERGAGDAFLAATKIKAADLKAEDKIFLLKNFFSLNFERMINPYQRYKELFEKRGHIGDPEKLREKLGLFSAGEFRDLQVWFNLAWSGNALKKEPEIQSLIWKGRNFTEEDKISLLNAQIKFMGKIMPAYQKAQARGQVEMSTSPYYHPILPLLSNINSAREALPNIELPNHDFHHPEDVAAQLKAAISCYRRQFGSAPSGLWPSEGSLSEDVMPAIREHGIRWVATDEEILLASLRRSGQLADGAALPPELKYTGYQYRTPSGPVHLFFRDHLLSDMIGFTYSTYEGESAADDLISRLMLIRKILPENDTPYAVPIILDGENAWEYYADNGIHFLRAFYRRLQESVFLKASTFSGYLEAAGGRGPELTKIRAGSWIYGSFSTWVGHPEKNKAWDLLAATRKKIVEISASPARTDEALPPDLQGAMHEVMIAEGSDWFWWYGEDHFSEYDREFDALFRGHLQRAWEHLRLLPPPELAQPIIQEISRFRIQRPFELLTPKLDGFITDYFEWLAAGFFSNQYSFTTMQQVHRIFNGFYFGFDHNYLYLRLDVEHGLLHDKKFPFIVEIHFRKPGDMFFRMVKDSRLGTVLFHRIRVNEAGEEVESVPLDSAGVAQIVELGIPFKDLGVRENQAVEFALKILIDGNLAERMPHEGYVAQKIAIDDLEKYYWIV